ncbi:Centrosomal protein kizuna [Bagarius yarrelli]|uniref:Centrosomal protein kizuna n=1 Tax=Bagarius yarrelli TaxID=175774 RepID=A0A556U9A7_BAGYA|nr:Centrosomal protein kizuna [Bagarius yarrelli]
MRQYHKELCKREQQAKTRNLELLRKAESLLLTAKEFSPNFTLLHHLKEHSRSLPLSTERTSLQPAITLIGWQPLKDSVMSAQSPTEPEPNHPSSSLLQSSPLMKAALSKTTSNKSLSDDILNSSDFPEGQPVFNLDLFMKEVAVCGSEPLACTHVTSKEQAVPESAQHPTPNPDHNKSRRSSVGSSDAEVTPELSLNPNRDDLVSLDGVHEQHAVMRSFTPSNEREISAVGVDAEEPLFPKPKHRLSVEEFFYLLDSIEERLSDKDRKLYSSAAVSEQKSKQVISLCSERGELRAEELRVCGAVVLQQLPWLLWDTPHGCLLHSDLVNKHWSTAIDPANIRSSLSGDSAALWERWFSHALQLLQQKVLSLSSIVQLFTPLLVHYNASYADKAEVLLKRLLTHAAETHHSAESEDSSCSLPSLLNDSAEIKLARPSRESISSAGEQSDEEDSTNQSALESMPVRETKAYQLLKQSVVQGNQSQNGHNEEEEEKEEGSDLEPSGLSDNEMTGRSKTNTQNMRNVSKKKSQAFSAVQSKAFWGDSDDTNSDIEMALRPRSSNTNNSDFDDFYD